MRFAPRMISFVLATHLIAGLGTVANAAEPIGTLARITGTAIVNQGADYVTGREGMSLAEGDRLLVLEGGSAVVTFADGCERTVADNELLIVPAVSTCAAGPAVADGAYQVAPYQAVAETPTADDSLGLRPAQAGGGAAAAGIAGGMTGGAVVAAVAGVAVAAGTVAAIDNASDDDDDDVRAISP